MSYDVCNLAYSIYSDQSPVWIVQEPTKVPGTIAPAHEALLERNKMMINAASDVIRQSRAGGQPVSLEAEANLPRFMRLLPPQLPCIEPYISPSGSICFDWEDDPDCQLSIMLQAGDRIAFAAYFDGERIHGNSRLPRTELPQALKAVAERWIACGAA